ncbi:MAG: hypothetical protein IT559_00110 [Alphaproteobacteria bacterium]|nr:hypothetical protein [Alphaproteobacteria bacterium]
MSDSFGELIKTGQKSKPACRVAYTLNNVQPVICTIIGDQPLFYMDFDVDYIDENAAFDASEEAILKNEINALKNSIKDIEDITYPSARPSHEKMEEFLSDSDEITQFRKKSKECAIEDLKTILAQSRLAAAYMDFAAQHGVEMHYSRLVEMASYDREAGAIFINPDNNMADQLLLAAQKLRHHWQHRQGALINPLMFHPDNAILVNRAQVADLAVSMVRIAWELQLSGERRAWQRIEESSMADLGRAFAREAFLDFRTINNGEASASVFESWFLSERCRAQDKTLISQMLADHRGYVFDLKTAGQAVTPVLIAALGAMPFGKNYLAEHAATIMGDPIFTDVRDRSNANFLWFIKFERSFRETERELQTSGDLSAKDARSAASRSNIQDSPDGPSKAATGQVVSLFPEGQNAGAVDKSGKNAGRLSRTEPQQRIQQGDDRSNVVYIRRWSGE